MSDYRRNEPKKLISMPVTIEELELLEQAYGAGHGLAGRLRSELVNIARVRLRRANGGAKPAEGSSFIREVFQKYGKGADTPPQE